MNSWRKRVKAWREIPWISFALSRSVWPLYRCATQMASRVPWWIRVNGGTVDFDGIQLVFPANVGIAYCTLGWWQGAAGYEPATWRVMKNYFQKADAFWDVGSNIGLYAALACKINPALKVQAFEPVPSLAAANRLFQKANRTRTEVRQLAVSSHGNGAEIAIRKYDDLTEAEPTSTLEKNVDLSPGATTEQVAVETVALDVLGDGLQAGMRLFIKIDVEGHENSVLQGAKRLLATHRPVIVCEILPGVAKTGEISSILIAAQYDAFAVCREGLFRIAWRDLDKQRGYTDYLLIPREMVDSNDHYFSFDAMPDWRPPAP